MAQDTFDISWVGNSIAGAKKTFVAEWRSSPFPIAAPPQEVFETLTGKTVISMGVGKRQFDLDLFVGVAAMASGHATVAEIRQNVFEAVDPTSNNLYVRDMEGNVYNVACINKSDGNAIKPTGRIIFGNAAVYKVTLKLKER